MCYYHWLILQLLFPHYLIPNTSGRIRTLNLRINNSSVLPLCCFWEILWLNYCHFLSPGTRFRIQTLNLNIMSQVFYNCSTDAGQIQSYLLLFSLSPCASGSIQTLNLKLMKLSGSTTVLPLLAKFADTFSPFSHSQHQCHGSNPKS